MNMGTLDFERNSTFKITTCIASFGVCFFKMRTKKCSLRLSLQPWFNTEVGKAVVVDNRSLKYRQIILRHLFNPKSIYFQLDAAELDSEIFTLTKSQLAKLFKYQEVSVYWWKLFFRNFEMCHSLQSDGLSLKIIYFTKTNLTTYTNISHWHQCFCVVVVWEETGIPEGNHLSDLVTTLVIYFPFSKYHAIYQMLLQ